MNFSWRGFPGGDEHWLVRGVCRGLFHRVRSRPVGSTFPGSGVPRRAVFPGEREWGALPGREEHQLVRGVARGLCHRVRSRPVGSTFPEARRSRGGVAVLNGWAGVWGHCLGGTSTGSSGELPGAISSSPIAARGLDVARGTTFPGVASPGGPPARGVAHLRYTIRAAPEPRSAARAAVVAAAVPAVAGGFAVGGCGGGLFGFHGIVGGLFLGAAVALGYRLEQFFLRRHALQLATQQLLDRRQLEGVVLAGEAERGALGAGAAGPADTVHVVLRIIRQGVVNHMADAVDVNTTAGDIGGDQYPQLAFAEVL